MQKDIPVLVMAVIFMLLISCFIIFGMIEKARYSGINQTIAKEKNINLAVKQKQIN